MKFTLTFLKKHFQWHPLTSSICHVQNMRGKVASLWIVSNHHRASNECLQLYNAYMFTPQIKTRLHLWMRSEKYEKYKQIRSTLQEESFCLRKIKLTQQWQSNLESFWAAIRINLRHVDIENNSFSRWQILNEMHATIGREISNGWGWGETREKLQDILLISQPSKPTHIRTFSRKHKKLATHQAY